MCRLIVVRPDNLKNKNMETAEKQIKLRDFVGREVYHNESMLVEELLEDGKFQYEDIENYYIDPKEYADHGYNSAQEFEDSGENINEIYEWWRVSDWLLGRLAKKGEPILRTDYGDYWGRTCTGQAILLDGVIEEIWDELQKV
jgi:hypothetical protein